MRYFKFDFLVWLDCVGPDGGDLYEYHDAFVAMLDRLRADHPDVTFQIDETNDYRLFPFESVTRGPSLVPERRPDVDRLLHNLWNLSPYVPAFSLGQHALANEDFAGQPVDTLMAAALLSHITFFHDLRDLPDAVIDRVGEWTAFYRQHRDRLGGVVYPLLADPLERAGPRCSRGTPSRRGRAARVPPGVRGGAAADRAENVPPGRQFELTSAPDGAVVGTFSSEQLRAGIDVRIAEREGARVLLIEPAP